MQNIMVVVGREGVEWEWELSSDSSASMLAVAPSVYRLFMVGRDKVPNDK